MTDSWTPEQVKHHIEAVLAERDRRYEARFVTHETMSAMTRASQKEVQDNAEKAIQRTEAAMEARQGLLFRIAAFVITLLAVVATITIAIRGAR